ncbi:integrase [Novosphingobium marinum]|uniref:Integrase n=1 Tax=Novosphingobium marinum TaxID=1514948 RepID=A0A7Y9XVN6_9SPHN|nr:site-specific integrase [Novosphingobium marinum]NYH95424.1 integrase [Novosphingobium marinum]GGC26963.1 integrase [Novosphingobium marinum]
MPTISIKKSTVDEARPGKRQVILWDTAVKGFGLLVLPSGHKSYVYQYRLGGRAGRTRRYTIGKHGDPWTPDQAREFAKDLAEAVRKGIDPLDEKRAKIDEARAARVAEEEEALRLKELSFDAVADQFLKSGLSPGTREGTVAGYRSALTNHCAPVFEEKPLPEISRRDVIKVLDAIPAEQQSVRRMAFAVMRLFFAWALSRDIIERSPLDGVKAPEPVKARDRILSDDELALALRGAALLSQPFGSFVELLVSTGQRRSEVAGLQWSELDRAAAEWTLPASRSKNGVPSVVPLNSRSVAILDRIAGVEDAEKPQWPRTGLLFTTTGKTPISGFSRAKAQLDAKMLEIARQDAEEAGDDPDAVTLAPWRFHDARRTFATAMQRLGVRFEVTEALLNHVSGASRSGVAAVYQRHDWKVEKRAAIEAWATFCDKLLAPAASADNIVPLRAATSSSGGDAP